MRSVTRAALLAAGLDPDEVAALVRRALAEDLGAEGDITSAAIIPADHSSTGDYTARAAGVLAGAPVVSAVVDEHLGDDAHLEWHRADGDCIGPGDVVATLTGPTRGLLEIERTSLNLLCHLSGVATLTSAWTDALGSTGTVVRDTRKTTPGLRTVEKYAVRCGGGSNHRLGLFDAVLVKDNHVLAAGGVGAALDAVHRRHGHRPGLVIEVEVDRLDQLDEALGHGATEILLDNMPVDDIAEAVRRARATRPGIRLEASGRLDIHDAAGIAATGVDFVAIGALTHSAPALDLGLDLRAR
jgi:nicotinate-nucleotide pyrophosphorylase (carboxylating)